MKTNKQIYLMMENVGRELYQTINSLDQIVITKAEFDKCFSGVEIPTILNSFPILKKGVFIQKVDNFSDFLIFEVADIKDTGYKLYCKSFQVKNETDFPLWAYNVEAVVSLEDAEEIEVKFFNFTNAQTVVYTKQKRYSVADDFVSQYISRYTLNIWTFIKVMQWINYLSENPEIKVIEKKESNRNGNKKKVPPKSVSAADPRIVKINGIKIVSSNDRLVQKLNSTGCICTDIKLNTFRKICCRAYCEKISGNGNMKVTEEEAKNLFFIESMQHITGCSSYEIIRTEDIPELFHVVKA